MRNTTKLLIGAACVFAAMPANAATFVFSSGNYIPGVTSPTPLLSPDILNITTGSNKFFNAVTFTNQSGTVNWQAGAIFLSNGAAVNNQSLWNATGDDSLNNNGGALSTFTNSGTFRKSAGTGATTIGSIAFVNSGVINAQTGSIDFNGGNAAFNAGSSFTGAGAVNINSNAAFNGAINSANLNFNAGIFTGTSASLTGTADWTAGNFSGGWTLTTGSTLTALTGSNKFIDAATITNNGTINWQDGALFLQNGSQLTNNGLLDYSASSSINNNGGALSTVINTATGTVHVGSGAAVSVGNTFVNNGGTLAADGVLNFTGGNATFNTGTSFTGAGDVNIASNAAFNGAISSTNLNFTGGIFTGTGASLTGTADWTAGNFSGGWALTTGSTLTALTGSNKFIDAATITNNGTINWQNGALFLQNGSQLTNNGLIDYSGSSSINNNGGAVSTVTNNAAGTVRVGAGSTLTVSNTFVNNGGTLAANGTLVFNGGNATFNTGTSFTGAGDVNIDNSAAFNGAISSANVNFNGGTFTGTSAALSGTADWIAGTFSGDWMVTAGSTMTALTGNNKFLNAVTFVNAGTVDWLAGALFLQNGTQLINNGLIDAKGNDSINNNGGVASAFVNNGLIEKTLGLGTTTLASGIGFDNNGTINVLSGTIGLPAAFTNDGTLGGTGTFSSANLTNGGIIAPGAPGSTGTLALTGNYAQTAFGTLATQLASTGSFDLFNISGTAALNGTLALGCILSCAINTGDSFVILNSVGNLSGTFANVTTNGFLSGFAYNVIYDYAADLVRLEVTNAGTVVAAVPEPSTWAMMLFGFGLIGSTLRRRSATGVSATV